jgi:hypothetical protein
MRKSLSFVSILLFFFATPINAQVYQFINGNLFIDTLFQQKTFFVSKGRLFFQKPAQVDSVIDLKGKYVIPPFAEGHNHSLESSYGLPERIQGFLKSGVFYAKIMSAVKQRLDLLLPQYNHPAGIDVAYGYAPVTATGGHPVRIREQAFDRGDYTGLFSTKPEIENKGYWIFDNKEDVDKKWPLVMSEKPQFLKIMLLYSEEFQKRKDDTAYFGLKGLNPDLISYIVDKAHRSGLKVAAHIESPHDFHIAIMAGVDEISHLPSLNKNELIDSKDAVLAAKRKIPVTSTVSLITRIRNEQERNALFKAAADNIAILKSQGVPLCIGSDAYSDNSVAEAFLLARLGVFSNAELLDTWFKTARYIFPERRIGELKEGYEASFLVLENNPVKNLQAVKNIGIRMKQGQFLL